MTSASPLLLFYPTSAVHVRDWQPVFRALEGWRVLALVFAPQEYLAPGVLAALRERGTPNVVIERGYDLDLLIPDDVSVVVLGAIFEAFALDLLCWARFHRIPVAAIEEVAQLGLNQHEINNYDAPFDRLFVASPDEYRRFIDLGYPPAMLKLSGLLAYDRLRPEGNRDNLELRKALGIADRAKPIVYTTTPLCSRISIHTKDTPTFRDEVFRRIAIASQRTERPVVIKLHPSEDRPKVRDQVRSSLPEAIVIGGEHSMDELFAITGVLVNRGNSQTCLEAILREVPTVVAACGIRTLFHEAGLRVVESIDAIPDAISRALSDVRLGVDDLRARYFSLPAEGVANLIARELNELAMGTPAIDDAGWDWLLRTALFAGELRLAFRLAKRLGSGTSWRTSVSAALEAHLSGKRDEAIARWHDCIGCDSTWYWPHFELAHAYQAAGRHQLAIEHAQQAIALLPSHYRVWHEIPMRRMVMAAHREMGHHAEAAAVMAALEERSLVDVLPELLLEKAMQLATPQGQYPAAIACLDQALGLIEEVPVRQDIDTDLRNQTQQLLQDIGARSESEHRFREAASCYSSILRTNPDDYWSRFALARTGLARFEALAAFMLLFRLSGIPGVSRQVSEIALPAKRASVLASLWPTSSGGIGKLARMVGHAYAWLAEALCQRRRDWPNYVAISLLLTLFFMKHLARSLLGRF